MNHILEFCTNAKLIGAEVVSTIVFLVFICVAAWREIIRFIAK